MKKKNFRLGKFYETKNIYFSSSSKSFISCLSDTKTLFFMFKKNYVKAGGLKPLAKMSAKNVSFLMTHPVFYNSLPYV